MSVFLEGPSQKTETVAIDMSRSGMQVWLPHGAPTSGWERARIALPGARTELSVGLVPVRVGSVDEALAQGESDSGGLVAAFVLQFDRPSDSAVLDRFIWDRFVQVRQDGGLEDLRQLPRIECLIDGVLVSSSGSDVGETPGTRLEDARIVDMSPDGLKLVYSGTLSPESLVGLRLSVPGDQRPLNLDGKVAYVTDEAGSGGTAGIAFAESMSDVNRARIRNFILASSAWGSLRGVYRRLWADEGEDGQLRVEERQAIQRLLRLVAARGLPVHLLGDDSTLGAEFRVDDVTDRFVVVSNLGLSSVPPKGSRVSGSMVVGSGGYYFQTRVVEALDTVLHLELPENLVLTEKRTTERHTTSDNQLWRVARERGPRSGGVGRLIDSSTAGISLEVHKWDFEDLTTGEVVFLEDGETSRTLRGEVRHLDEFDSETGRRLKIGIELGTQRKDPYHRRLAIDAFRDIPVYTDAATVADCELFRSMVVQFPTRDRRRIVGLLNATRLGRVSTAIVIPSAFGKKKEALAPLALTLLASYCHNGEDVVVLRFDGTDRPGESSSRLAGTARGYEMLGYRISQGRSDLEAALDFVRDNPFFSADRIILGTFSMSALDARRFLSECRNRGDISAWISVMGVPAAKSALIQTLGGLDIVGNHVAGLESGVCGLLGHLLDMDQVAADLVSSRYAYVTDARSDMAKIDLPVLWMYGTHDRWVGPEEVYDIMSVDAGAPRSIFEIPAGHNLRTSDDALRTFRIIAAYALSVSAGGDEQRDVLEAAVDLARTAPRNELLDLVTYERERLDAQVSRESMDDYWQRYLIGNGSANSGYDFYRMLEPFLAFLKEEADVLGVAGNHRVLDAGCGTGLFLELLVKRLLSMETKFSGEIVATDLVPAALDRAKQKIDALQGSLGSAISVTYQALDLEPSRLIPIARYLGDPKASIESLRGRIDGLSSSVLEHLVLEEPEELRRVIEGCLDSAMLTRREPSDETCEVLRELSRAGRFLNGTLQYADLSSVSRKLSRSDTEKIPNALYKALTADDLKFDRLDFRGADLDFRLPFPDSSFDRIVASLFISYLFNPDYFLEELHRILRPDGRVVVSSMKPDADISVIFTDFVDQLSGQRINQTTMAGARQMLSEAAALFELEEEGLFRFYSQDELVGIVEDAGFSVSATSLGLGIPAQAVIVVAEKRTHS